MWHQLCLVCHWIPAINVNIITIIYSTITLLLCHCGKRLWLEKWTTNVNYLSILCSFSVTSILKTGTSLTITIYILIRTLQFIWIYRYKMHHLAAFTDMLLLAPPLPLCFTPLSLTLHENFCAGQMGRGKRWIREEILKELACKLKPKISISFSLKIRQSSRTP